MSFGYTIPAKKPAAKKPAAKLPSYSFKPYVAPAPTNVQTAAAGYYDPALLAQQGAADRGYAYAHDDALTQLQRLQDSYGVDTSGVQRATARTLQDLGLQQQRGSQDFTQSSGRNAEDHTSQLAALQRNYLQLAGRQQEGANAAGVLSGGALLQAAAKRAANQAIDQQPIDTNFQRTGQDLQSGFDRLTQDTGIATGRANEDQSVALSELARQLGYNTHDVTTADTRAGYENQQFHVDTGNQIAYQATQAGYQPPAAAKMASNEFVAPDGSHYKIILTATERLKVAPDGHIISRSKR